MERPSAAGASRARATGRGRESCRPNRVEQDGRLVGEFPTPAAAATAIVTDRDFERACAEAPRPAPARQGPRREAAPAASTMERTSAAGTSTACAVAPGPRPTDHRTARGESCGPAPPEGAGTPAGRAGRFTNVARTALAARRLRAPAGRAGLPGHHGRDAGKTRTSRQRLPRAARASRNRWPGGRTRNPFPRGRRTVTTERDRLCDVGVADNREPPTGAGRRTLEVANPASTDMTAAPGSTSRRPGCVRRTVWSMSAALGAESRPSAGTPAGPRGHPARGAVEPPQPEAGRGPEGEGRRRRYGGGADPGDREPAVHLGADDRSPLKANRARARRRAA